MVRELRSLMPCGVTKKINCPPPKKKQVPPNRPGEAGEVGGKWSKWRPEYLTRRYRETTQRSDM